MESTIGRRLYVRFDLGLDNIRDTTVSPSLLATAWCASDLGMAVRQLHYSELRKAGRL